MITLLFEPKNGAVVNKFCMAVSEKAATKFSSSKLRFALVCHKIFAAGLLLLFALQAARSWQSEALTLGPARSTQLQSAAHYVWPCTQHAADRVHHITLGSAAGRSWHSEILEVYHATSAGS